MSFPKTIHSSPCHKLGVDLRSLAISPDPCVKRIWMIPRLWWILVHYNVPQIFTQAASMAVQKTQRQLSWKNHLYIKIWDGKKSRCPFFNRKHIFRQVMKGPKVRLPALFAKGPGAVRLKDRKPPLFQRWCIRWPKLRHPAFGRNGICWCYACESCFFSASFT